LLDESRSTDFRALFADDPDSALCSCALGGIVAQAETDADPRTLDLGLLTSLDDADLGRGGGSVARSRDHAAGVEAAGETTEETGSNAIVPPAPPLPSAMEVDGASLEDEAENDRTGRVEPVALTAPAPAEASMCALCSAVLFGAAVMCNKCHSSFHAACVKRGAQHVHKAFMCDACLAAKPPPDAQALAATGTAKRAKTNKGKVADFHKRALGAMV